MAVALILSNYVRCLRSIGTYRLMCYAAVWNILSLTVSYIYANNTFRLYVIEYFKIFRTIFHKI